MTLDNVEEEITYFPCDSIFEGKLCAGVLKYFKNLQDNKKKSVIFPNNP